MNTDIAVIGGGIAGLAIALFYADKGADVTVFEQDPNTVTHSLEAVVAAPHHRRSTPQDRHSHALLAAGRDILAQRCPDLLGELKHAGAREQAIDGDRQMIALLCRRSVLECVLREHARCQSRVRIAEGRVVGLDIDGGRRRVCGLRTRGAKVSAGLVVDAGGRRSPVAHWLRDAGVPGALDIRHPCEFTIVTRFYQLERWPDLPLNRGAAAGGIGPACACLAFPGDNRSLSISMGVHPRAPFLNRLRDARVFSAVARLHPLVAPWIAPAIAHPDEKVHVMSGWQGRLTSPPPIDGMVSIGDATCTTNPVYGRGMSLALVQAAATVDGIDPGARETRDVAARVIDDHLRPWFDDAVAQDRLRTARWHGEPPPDEPLALAVERAGGLALTDPVIRRAAFRRFNLLDEPRAITEILDTRTSAALPTSEPAWAPGPTESEILAVSEFAA